MFLTALHFKGVLYKATKVCSSNRLKRKKTNASRKQTVAPVGLDQRGLVAYAALIQLFVIFFF
jgi:hypothetical protein